MATNTEPSGFGAFFQRYTKTWMHAVATAGLTAFGLLTFVHRGFVVLALACYIIPPIVLYISRRGDDSTGNSTSPTDAALAEQNEPSAAEQDEPSESERIEPEDRSAPESGADSLGPPPAEPESRADSPSEDERESLEGTSADDRDPGVEPEAGSKSPPSSEPERESTVEAGRSTDAEADREPDDQEDVEPEPEPASESTEPADDDDVESEPEPEPTATTSAPETDGESNSNSESEPEWHPTDVPTEATLLDAAVASSGAVAVGEGGVVAKRDDEDWTVVLEDGPAAQGQTLTGVDVTDDGKAAWVAGDGGAVGRLDLASGRHTDYSAPDDRTDNLAGIAVAGGEGEETVLAINGSGEVLRGRYRDGDCSWDEPATPGSGSSLSDVVLGDEVGYCCDTNDGVFATEDGGRSFERIGIEDADGTPAGIAAGEGGGGGEDVPCHLCTDDGVVHRYDGSRWTPERVCEDSLTGIARAGERLAVCTADGAIHERGGPTADWEGADADAPAGLEAIAVGDDLGVAVGDEGAVIERR